MNGYIFYAKRKTNAILVSRISFNRKTNIDKQREAIDIDMYKISIKICLYNISQQ